MTPFPPPRDGGLFSRYVAWSAGLHFLLISLFLFSATSKPKRVYYGVQFLGGQSGRGTGRMEPAPPPAPSRPAAEPAGKPASASKETPVSKSVKDKIPVKKADAKSKKTTTAKTTPAKTPSSAKPDKKGVPGGRGASPEGRGDLRGSDAGPVGGVGNSLEIGGFGPGGGNIDSARFPYAWYVNLLYRKLWQNWDMKDPGTRECVVSFTIARDGALEKLKVLESSGDSVYDYMARRAVEVSAPFSALPEGYKEPDLPVIVRFKLQ